jgi:hypothetical protein
MSSIGRVGARKRRRLITLISVGWRPPSLGPSGACLGLGARVSFSLITPTRTAPHRGCVSSNRRAKPGANGVWAFKGLGLGRQWDLLGNRPHKCTQFPGNSNDHLIGGLSSGDQLPRAFAQAGLRLPTDILDGFGHLLKAQLEMATDLGRIAVCPGAFDQGPAGMRIPGLGDAALTAPLARRVF